MSQHSEQMGGLLDAAISSTYFSAPRVAEDIEHFLAGPARAIGSVAERLGEQHSLVLIGSGGSLACLYTAQYVLQRTSVLPISVVPARELRWREPGWLGPRTAIVFNSWSGHNADVLDALDYARSAGAGTLAVTTNPESALARGVDHTILYTGRSIFEVPILAVIELARALPGFGVQSSLEVSLLDLPGRLRALMPSASARAKLDAAKFTSTELFYILGAGPYSSLALKYANVFMENMRVGAAYYDAVEFRHGAVEALSRFAPAMIFLVGEDESRGSTLALADFCATEGAVVLRYDAADYALGQPMLGPLVMNSFLQWFVVYSALARQISDLDERVYMGTGRLSEGGWP